MERLTAIEEVRVSETRGGNTRYAIRDADGNDYTTFRERIGRQAQELQGQRVRLEFHEEQRGQYTNVYLDKVQPVSAPADTDVKEAAWHTAVEAAPWLIGKPAGAVQPDALYEQLKPFEARVERDIEEAAGSAPED